MKEKERYEWNSRFDEAIKDNQTGDIVNAVEVLNKQDKRIKELEQESYPVYKREHQRRAYLENIEIPKLNEENQQLKQQLEDTEESYNNTMRYLNKTRSELLNLPNKIVEEIREKLNNIVEVGDYFNTETDEETNLLKQSDIENILDTILKKYGG